MAQWQRQPVNWSIAFFRAGGVGCCSLWVSHDACPHIYRSLACHPVSLPLLSGDTLPSFTCHFHAYIPSRHRPPTDVPPQPWRRRIRRRTRTTTRPSPIQSSGPTRQLTPKKKAWPNMSRPGFEYAQLPPFSYQTYDRDTLSFSAIPLVSVFGGPPADESNPIADPDSIKDTPPDEGTANPEDSSSPAPGTRIVVLQCTRY